jgi:membrane-bound lytic murein transglycosylase D
LEEPVLKSRILAVLSMLAVALLQACASQLPQQTPPAPSQAEAPAPPATSPAAPVAKAPAAPAPEKPKPAPPAALDATKLPPFDGKHIALETKLRGVIKIDRTVPADDLWQRIRHGFAIPNLNDALVKRKTSEYAANSDYLQRILDRSRLYLYHIVEEIEKRGLPTELALLPMVESAFNPLAYSRAHASGLWQFIPGTGKRYNLEQSWWRDERRDVVDSTNAALDYLTSLYEMHGDWHLALASYNWGENAVKRAVQRNKRAGQPTDYSSLRMPRETRHYIPKLQALKNIIADPEPYGIDLDPIPNEPYFEVVDDAPDIDVMVAAKLAEMSVQDFVALNPAFSRPLIRASGAVRIILPADKVDVFRQNLAKMDEKSLVSWQIYHPRRGEKLATIANKYKFSLAELRRVNGIPSWSSQVPRVMVVPINAGAEGDVGMPPIMYAPPTQRVHIVRRGDTLSGIAARYRLGVSALKNWNRHLGRYLQVGQRVHLGPPAR